MPEHTNMPELLNRFMETSNIAIKPAATRLHRLVILRFIYSFGQCSDVGTCITKLLDAGINLGTFNHQTIEVRQPFAKHMHSRLQRPQNTNNKPRVKTQTGLVHNLTTMQINEWVELINLLHVETFVEMVAEMRERYQENERNSSPVLIIYNTLEVRCPLIFIEYLHICSNITGNIGAGCQRLISECVLCVAAK